MLYCFTEPPPERNAIVRSAVIALNTLFWPFVVGLGLAGAYSVRRWGRTIKDLVSGVFHSPALFTFVCFAASAIFLLGRALYGDQSSYVVHYFWPGVVCFFVAATALAVWVVSHFRAGQQVRHDSRTSDERI
jgi:hypothetical protein